MKVNNFGDGLEKDCGNKTLKSKKKFIQRTETIFTVCFA